MVENKQVVCLDDLRISPSVSGERMRRFYAGEILEKFTTIQIDCRRGYGIFACNVVIPWFFVPSLNAALKKLNCYDTPPIKKADKASVFELIESSPLFSPSPQKQPVPSNKKTKKKLSPVISEEAKEDGSIIAESKEEAASAVEELLYELCWYEGKLEKIKELLTLPNIDLNKPFFLGETCLHRAARKGHLQIVRLLLEHGAKNILDKTNITPAEAASSKEIKELILLSNQSSAKIPVVSELLVEQSVGALDISSVSFW